MLNGEPLDSIAIPPGENPPFIPMADVSQFLTPLEGDAPPITEDLGDFYFHFDEQIALLRARDEFVVGLAPGVAVNEVVTALTGESGALEGYTLTATFGADRILLSRPFSVEFVTINLTGVESTLGVEWASPSLVGEDSGAPAYLSQEIAVALAPGVDPNQFFGAEFSGWRRFFDNQYIATITEGGGLAALTLANELTTDPNVQWAAPNFDTEFRTAAIPNDPSFGDQWHLRNTGQNGAPAGADAALDDAWDVNTGSSNVVVAVLDNGVQTNHPDLNIFVNTGEIAGNQIDDDGNGFVDDVNGWDFVGDDPNQPRGAVPDNNPNPTTVHDDHGTAVAGIAGAIGNNGLGVTGAIQNVRLLPIKIARDDIDSGGGFVHPEIIAEAIYYAAGAVLDANNMLIGRWRGADVLVNSWGGGMPNVVLTAAFNWATTQGREGRGVPSFNAAGNFADATVPQLRYQQIDIPVTPGQKQYVWSYQTNGDNTFLGENRAWIADIELPNGAHELLGADATLATGWTSPGAQPWTIEDDPAHAYGTARFVARAGALTTPSQQSNLFSPVINVTAAGTLSFARYVSSQLQFDQFNNPISDSLVLFESTNGGTFMPVWGNAGNPFPVRPVSYPADLANVISVGASTDWDYRSAYSQFGTDLDLVAPSSGGYASITTTDRTGAAGYSSGDYASTFTGTSAATPLAAGIAALMLAENPNLTAAQIREMLQDSADKVGGNFGATAYNASGFNQFYGYGRVNAAAALEAIAPTVTAVTVSGPNTLDGVSGSYLVPAGNGNQIKTVPIGGAHKFSITFSEPVTLTGNELSLYGVFRQHSYSLSYVGMTGNTATWQLASENIPGDQLVLTLDDQVTDLDGNRLDGEWTNPTSITTHGSSVFPTGDGGALGDFVFYVTIMPGDVTPNGSGQNIVNGNDHSLLLTNYNGVNKPWTVGEVNGISPINGSDNSLLLNNFDGRNFQSWPSPAMSALTASGGEMDAAFDGEGIGSSTVQNVVQTAAVDALFGGGDFTGLFASSATRQSDAGPTEYAAARPENTSEAWARLGRAWMGLLPSTLDDADRLAITLYGDSEEQRGEADEDALLDLPGSGMGLRLLL
jgi:subtilisin family serine protease